MLPKILPVALWGAAGSYPNQPSRRFAWDADGSVVYGYAANAGADYTGTSFIRGSFFGKVLSELSTANKEAANNDADDYYGHEISTQQWGMVLLLILFPQKREIDGYYWNVYNQETIEGNFLSKSADTTNGIDGSWTALGSEIDTGTNQIVKPDYRQNINSANESNILGIYQQYLTGYTGISSGLDVGIRALHLYGTITAGETPDRILYLDTLNSDAEFTRPLDYGNRGRGTTYIRTIKLKNNSSTLTANTVQITAEEIGPTDGSAMIEFSTDGVPANSQATLNVGNITNGSTSTVYVHLAIPDAQALDLYDTRLSTNVASWT